jgi:imidazolonepropionase-like amidohydrolase
MRSLAIKVAAGLGLAAISISAQTPVPSGAPASSFDLHFIGHKIGSETTTVVHDAAGDHFQSVFHFDDRGTAIDLSASLDLRTNGDPEKLTVKGRNYRLFQSDSEVEVLGDSIRVRDLGVEREVTPRGKPFFPIDNYAPIHVQQQLIRYWIRKGRPAEIMSAPSGPIRIRERGRETADFDGPAGGSHIDIARLSIDGAVWGTETAWIDLADGRLLGLTTWAGALPFQATAVSRPYPLILMFDHAVRDRMSDLRALTAATPTVATKGFVLRGATLIDGNDRAPIANADVIVSDGRIRSVSAGPSANAGGLPVIDARGKWIIPGLWDMHAHASQVDWAPVYLAGGVTTIRDLGGEEGFLVAMRDEIASGRALGPRYLMAGLIDGPGPRAFGAVSVSTPEEAIAAADRYKKEGFNEIKIYIVTPPALVPVITAEAHKLGMTVTGHVPTGMTAQQVVEQGFDGIAHMQLRGQPGSDQAKQLIDFFKAHNTVMDPTMSWNELSGRPASIPLDTMLPGANGLPLPLARMFRSMSPGNGGNQTAGLQLIKAARDAGLLVVPGTDKGVPGLSLQRELELYVQGGMTPLEAIQAGSIVSAKAMKLDKEVGTIETGKRADLVILDADPLADIRNIRKASRVVAAGKLYDAAALWKAAGYIRSSPDIR